MKSQNESGNTSSGQGPHIPDWKLERYLLGELSAEEARRIRDALRVDAALRARLEALQQSNRDVLEKYPPAWMNAQVHGKLDEQLCQQPLGVRRHHPLRYWALPALSLAAVAVLFLAIAPSRKGPANLTTDQPVPAHAARIKGIEPELLLFRKTDSGSEQLENGAAAREHDLILIHYKAAGQAYGVILSADGRGTITQHLPATGSTAQRLQTDGAISLEYAYELDDAPDWEVFYFVTSDAPFEVTTATEALKRLIAETPPPGEAASSFPQALRQIAFTLVKEKEHA
jgi:hypothetical protein